jgi:hypothetical protein
VDSADQAEAVAVGSYSMIGKIFSLDLQIKDKSGKSIARAFEQGESADDVIPSVGRLAGKVGKAVAKSQTVLSSTPVTEKTVPVVVASVSAPQIERAVIKPVVPVVTPPAQGEIVRPDPLQKAAESSMIGQRLDGAMVAIAPGKKLPGDEREIFMALEREIRLYRQGKTITLLSALSDFRANEKILGIDSADLDNDGVLEIYVTMIRGDRLASQVWTAENGKFSRISADLPYFFRMTPTGTGKMNMLAQEMGSNADFMAEIGTVGKKGNVVEVKPFRKLASAVSLYTVAWIEAGNGRLYTVSLNEDGYLLVRDEKNEELWRSSDRFGGSESFFSREDQQNVRVTGELFRKVYLDQRFIAAANGEIVIPRNQGIWNSGTGRSFSKNSVYSFAWNGAVLEERWHTRESGHYLPDYFFDEQRNELVLLEVIQKDGIIQKGASAISIKKIN